MSDYKYSISGKLEKSEIELLKSIKNNFLQNEIKDIHLSNIQLKTVFSPKLISVNGIGKYSFNNLDFLNINFENNYKDDVNNLILNFDYSNNLYLDLINFKKKDNYKAKISLNLEKKKT